MGKHNLKGAIIGPSNAGKTTLLNCFEGKPNPYTIATVGMGVFSTKRDIDGHEVTYELWDTAGTERHLSLGTSFFRNVHFCILVIDLTDSNAFHRLDFFYGLAKREIDTTDPEFPYILVGNKCEMVESRRVTQNEIDRWCQVNNVPYYFATSALNGSNVDAAFLSVGRRALLKKLRDEPDPYKETIKVTVNNTKKSEPDSGWGCC